MAAKKSSVNKVFTCLSLVLLISIIAVVNNPMQPAVTFADEEKTAEANKEAEPNESGKEEVPRPDHNHRAFSERVEEREKMVARQIKARDVKDPNVLNAMRTVPRHRFVRHDDLRRAYSDQPLPIGKGQTISQPYIVGYMTDALELSSESKVLEIGTGSGYQAAVAAEIAREVYTIEIIEALAETAEERLKELGYRNVFAKAGDGYYGWEEKGPFDAIIITAAAGLVPPPLKEQLKPGGKMILPLGSPYGAQTLVLITKDEKGKIHSRSLLPVRFVPMTGQVQRAK
jgi:protein-L-isoaspartate(D-aspartate) O-methyltransferase